MRKIIDKIEKKIYLKLYDLIRKRYLKKFICNIGEIVEEEDKIICYVNQEKIDKYKGNNPIYDLRLNGIIQVTDEIKENVESFDLNKPIYYIFDGIKFNTGIQIKSLYCNVIFKNCIFDKNIWIIWGDEITFENNKYIDECPVYFYGDCFLTVGGFSGVNKLTFINDNFVNSYNLKHYGKTNFGMKIKACLIEFIDTKIDTDVDYPLTIEIEAKKLKIENSNFSANELYIDSESIEYTNSSIIARNGVIVENANCDFMGNIESSIVLYNGIDLANQKNDICKVNDDEATLKNARQELIGKLRNLSDYCQKINDDKVREIKDDLDSQAVIKVLKQKSNLLDND